MMGNEIYIGRNVRLKWLLDFQCKGDTLEMAAKIGCPESVIARMLPPGGAPIDDDMADKLYRAYNLPPFWLDHGGYPDPCLHDIAMWWPTLTDGQQERAYTMFLKWEEEREKKWWARMTDDQKRRAHIMQTMEMRMVFADADEAEAAKNKRKN